MHPEMEKLLTLNGRKAPPKILIAAAECSPLAKTGGLADVVGALPIALADMGMEARVITPYHRCIKEKYGSAVEHLCYFYVDLGWRHQYVGLEKICVNGLTVYLVDNEYYFGDRIYLGGEREGEQYAFFQRAVMEAIPRLDFEPDVLHCNDWHTAMLPFLVKTQYAGAPQGRLRTVITIHNLAYQGKFSFDFACDMLNIDRSWCTPQGIAHYDCANFLKTGILFADRINTVSPSYAREICTPEFGEGLQDVLIYRGGDMCGIINGIDTAAFDPAKDKNLVENYDLNSQEKKLENKRALMAEMGLEPSIATPIIAMVTRMTPQKGFDIVLEGIDAIIDSGASFVLLGTGDSYYENAMTWARERHPGRIGLCLNYNESLANRIYAGSDFLLMPSAFEPCGLSQMIAMRYGTVPIVHSVGGLRDSVRRYDESSGDGNGFAFEYYSTQAMLDEIRRAVWVYGNGEAFSALVRNAMAEDFGFANSALEYAKLYISVLDSRNEAAEHRPFDLAHRSPFGAVRCGQQVTLAIDAAEPISSAELVIGGESIPMERDGGRFVASYTAPSEPCTVWYSFRLSGSVSYGENGLSAGEAAPFQLTVYDPDFETPAWAEGAVMYQIFPDRFARGGDAFEKGVKYHRRRGREIEVHEYWNEPVKYRGENGLDYCPNDFFGGTLEGVRKSLPELKELGVDVIYLNPIFEADSNHRYNTADYLKIDPMLGTQKDLKSLCADAKKMGIRIILDGVFSHTGDDSVYFNRWGRYKEPGAYQGPESRYFSWYDFRAYPDDYRSWWGFKSLPEVNEGDPEWQQFIISGDKSVIRHWLRQGAGGWRLDVADELPEPVISMMRSAVKEESRDALLLGEVWEDATNKVSYGEMRRYALGRGLDSVMNYPFRVNVIDFALGRINAFQLRDFFLRQKMNYPAPMYRCLMNLLGSHDTVRLRTVLASGQDGSGMSREEQAEFVLTKAQEKEGKALQKLCAALQFAVPGMPCVYYGDEEGMVGFRDPFCRESFRRQDDELRAYYTALAAYRHSSGALMNGDAHFAAFGDDVVCVLRSNGDETVLMTVNRGSHDVKVRLTADDFPGLADAALIPGAVKLTAHALSADYLTVKGGDGKKAEK